MKNSMATLQDELGGWMSSCHEDFIAPMYSSQI